MITSDGSGKHCIRSAHRFDPLELVAEPVDLVGNQRQQNPGRTKRPKSVNRTNEIRRGQVVLLEIDAAKSIHLQIKKARGWIT